MTLQAYPVKVENGIVRSIDGSPLPQHAYAVLVILPHAQQALAYEDWRQPFDAFFAAVESQPMTGLNEVSDDELNTLVHEARQPS